MKTILLVDSEPFQRILIRELLSADPSITALETNDGKIAYTLALEHHPDLVILDVLLPRLDGPSLCCLIRENPALRQTRLMVMTALRPEMCQPLPCDAFLTRPYDDEVFLDTVNWLLGIPRA